MSNIFFFFFCTFLSLRARKIIYDNKFSRQGTIFSWGNCCLVILKKLFYLILNTVTLHPILFFFFFILLPPPPPFFIFLIYTETRIIVNTFSYLHTYMDSISCTCISYFSDYLKKKKKKKYPSLRWIFLYKFVDRYYKDRFIKSRISFSRKKKKKKSADTRSNIVVHRFVNSLIFIRAHHQTKYLCILRWRIILRRRIIMAAITKKES